MRNPVTSRFSYRSPAVKALLDYWASLPRRGYAPLKRDFNPMALRGSLSHALLLDIGEPDDILLRVVGTAHVNRLGKEVTGQNMLLGFEERLRPSVGLTHWLASRHPFGTFAEVEETSSVGSKVSLEVITLPLLGDTDERSFLISVGYALNDRATGHKTEARHKRLSSWHRPVVIDLGNGIPDDLPAPNPELGQSEPITISLEDALAGFVSEGCPN
jgi:hypothetical protein